MFLYITAIWLTLIIAKTMVDRLMAKTIVARRRHRRVHVIDAVVASPTTVADAGTQTAWHQDRWWITEDGGNLCLPPPPPPDEPYPEWLCPWGHHDMRLTSCTDECTRRIAPAWMTRVSNDRAGVLLQALEYKLNVNNRDVLP